MFTVALHLCPDCARVYLQPEEETKDVSTPTLTGVLEQQLKLEQTAEDLKELDSRQCPVCGLSFYEFRQEGRLGCPYDYEFFGDELEPLLVNVHGDNHHKGKQPLRGARDTSGRTEIIRMRREMKEAIEREDYEDASKLRDAIRNAEKEDVE